MRFGEMDRIEDCHLFFYIVINGGLLNIIRYQYPIRVKSKNLNFLCSCYTRATLSNQLIACSKPSNHGIRPYKIFFPCIRQQKINNSTREVTLLTS